MNWNEREQLSLKRLAQLTADDFEPLTDRIFSIQFSKTAETVPLQLSQVRILGNRTERTSFALDFDGPLELPLPQGTYLLAHTTLGEFALFIVPVGADRTRRQYEAIFNG